jgi:hypothetical protein
MSRNWAACGRVLHAARQLRCDSLKRKSKSAIFTLLNDLSLP